MDSIGRTARRRAGAQATRAIAVASMCLAGCLPAIAGGLLEDATRLAAEVVRYEFGDLPEGFPPSVVRQLGGSLQEGLSLEFVPPADAPRRVHFGDETTCDAMAVDYRVGEWPVRLVKIYGVVVLAVHVGRQDFGSPDAAREFVAGILGRAFRDAARLNLTVEALPDGTYRGYQKTAWASPEERLAKQHWFDNVFWSLDKEQLRIGFSTWRPGGSSLWSPVFEDCHYWFRYVKPGAPLPDGAPTGSPEGR